MLDALLAFLVPPDIDAASALALMALSFIASAMTGALGIGGGVLMLMVMAQLLPPAVLLPVHGVVQVGSNLGRAVLMRADIARPLVPFFVAGSLAGVAIGAQIVVSLPRSVLLGLLGSFILWSIWTPKLRPANLPAPWFTLVGLVSAFCTMFVGATGALVAAFLVPDPLTRHQVVATNAAFMTMQHGLKVGAFTALGFAFLPWLPMLATMIALGFVGTIIGRRLLDRTPGPRFALGFKLVLTALALKIVHDAWRAWPL
jgi:uncharacterized membrane protein YfcA